MQIVQLSDPLVAPTWVMAAFTIVLAVGASVTAVFAFLAFRKQSDELATLRGQADDQRATNAKLTTAAELQAQELRESLDERRRDREQRHRAQASRVFISQATEPVDPGSTIGYGAAASAGKPLPLRIVATVSNSSDLMISDVDLRWHQGSGPYGEPNPEKLGAVTPDQSATSSRVFGPAPDLERDGAVVTFRDAAGTRWLRRPDGDLQEQQGPDPGSTPEADKPA